MKKRHSILRTAVFGIVVVLLLSCSGKNGEGEGKADGKPEIITVEKGDIRVIVEATGRVVPDQEVEIKCKASGEIIRLPVDVSDIVKKGDLLLQLDPEDEERSVKRAQVALAVSQAQQAQSMLALKTAERDLVTAEARAKATLASSEAKWHEAKLKLQRVEQLHQKQMASQEELDASQSTFAQAAADYESAKAGMEDLKTQALQIKTKRQEVRIAEAAVETDRLDLSDAEQRLAETTVVAPIDGVVAEKSVQVGQIIASGINNVGGGTTVMTLADLSRIFILVSVDESDIGEVRIGQPAKITVDAYPGILFQGGVNRVATKGDVNSNVVTFEVKVEVNGDNQQLLKPEMTANVEILAVEKFQVLQVPVKALERRRNEQYVTVRKADGKEERKPVTTGATDGVIIEIVSGLREGDQVVISAQKARSRWQTGSEKESRRPHPPGGVGMMKKGPRK